MQNEGSDRLETEIKMLVNKAALTQITLNDQVLNLSEISFLDLFPYTNDEMNVLIMTDLQEACVRMILNVGELFPFT